MYKYIEAKESFRDLNSDLAKITYGKVMSLLDNVSRPNISNAPYHVLTSGFLNKKSFLKQVNFLCDRVFLDENNNVLAKELVEKRSDFSLGGYPYGFVSYDTNKEKLIKIEGGKYQIAPVMAIHELTHAIGLLNKVVMSEEYEELLSIFNEIRAAKEMGQEVYDEWLFNKIIKRLSYRVYVENLSDEFLQNSQIDNTLYFQGYYRMLDLIYALRLYDLYVLFPQQVYQDVSDILVNKGSILDLLKKYHISLENRDTILAFEKEIAEYEEIVNKYFSDKKGGFAR